MRWSAISCFNSCPKKYKLQLDGWTKQEDGEETTDLRFGQAIHSALEAHYKGAKTDETIQKFRETYQEQTEKKEKSLESGIETLKNYIEHYKEQDKDWRVIGAELADSVETLTGNHELHIDLVAEHLPSGSIYFWDHKSSAKPFSPMYWKKFEFSSQMLRYTKYVEDKFGSCAGCVINGISVGHRKRAYMGEPAGYHQKFERQIFNYSKDLISMWLNSDAQWERMIKWAEDNDCFPSQLGSLCGWCEFYPYCMAGEDKMLLESLYQQTVPK
jgi:hypothetical protein